ncbi:MAG: YdiU family protein [Motiliproteus sp.]
MFHSPLIQTNSFAALEDECFFSMVQPTPLVNPRMVHFNPALATEFGLDADDFNQEAFLDYLGGKALPDKLNPLAMAYSGHQFGQFNPGLGDGRAILLGEFQHSEGVPWEFQLKGSGPTPYSRGFDGRAVLRSVIREYLGSEAMWALGIPTTRALCLVDSDTPVIREQVENGSMMIRVAPNHIRFGSFERFFGQGQHQQIQILADFCIENHHPDIHKDEDQYGKWFDQIILSTARMVAHWQAVGFCHGVMNTDNFSILGLTFDYGPYGFMEHYDPGHVCNHSDHEGRYAYDQQPRMAFWNCLCLGRALTPIINRERLERSLELYESELQAHYLKLIRNKLGLMSAQKEDSTLVTQMLELLKTQRLDYSRFFRGLSEFSIGQPGNPWVMQQGCSKNIIHWLEHYQNRLQSEGSDCQQRQQHMKKHNPKYILRNYLAQNAIELAQQGDYSEVGKLIELLHSPFDEHPECEQYADPAPESASNIQISCSS